MTSKGRYICTHERTRTFVGIADKNFKVYICEECNKRFASKLEWFRIRNKTKRDKAIQKGKLV